MTEIVQKTAPLILEQIKKAHNILLHCHPSPDPDSVCSALATKLALEQLGRKVTVIRGDNDIPPAFMHFPHAQEIVMKNFFEIDIKDFDLFIILDSDLTRISNLGEIKPPSTLILINIDHHATNKGGSMIDLIEPTYPSNCELLADIFSLWNILITPDMARNLFIGMYTDTGGFKYRGVSSRTFEIASRLIAVAPDCIEYISKMESSNTPGFIAFEGLALSSIEEFLGGNVALASVSLKEIEDKKINPNEAGAGFISHIMRTVGKWKVTGALVETEPSKVKASFRTSDADKYDVSLLASALGGGGHKAAAATILSMSLPEARDAVVLKMKELYNL